MGESDYKRGFYQGASQAYRDIGRANREDGFKALDTMKNIISKHSRREPHD